MPPHFPRSNTFLGRADSKNPATTCKGVTTTGKPCRRDIAAAKPSKSGVLAVTSVGDNEGAAAYFCWQHKDQAETLINTTPAGQGAHLEETHIVPLQKRGSVDTLIGRLGILDIDDAKPGKKPRPAGQSNGKIQRPPTWNRVNGPLMSVPENVMNGPNRPGTYKLPVQKSEPGFWASLCCLCIGGDDEEYEIVRRKKQSEANQQQPPEMSQTSRPPQGVSSRPAQPTATPSNSNNPTERLLSFIPPSVSPQTASLLMAEASKPLSAKDEPGFIYIFWLTEGTDGSKPSDRDASALLSRPGAGGRNTSDLLRQHSVKENGTRGPAGGGGGKGGKGGKNSHILLKIGRANNVFRRMKEWETQCGKTPSLVRFYPYVKSTSPGSSPDRLDDVVAPKGDGKDAAGVHKAPYIHKVERLIHIELAQQRVIRNCDVCGREHKEWFEVEASKAGVTAVDEVVKRWIRWAEELKV